MQNKFDEKALEKASALADSPEARRLAQLLSQIDPKLLAQIKKQAAAGNLSATADALAPFLASEEVKTLIKQLGG